jgi:hypothetical protein
LRSKKRTVLRDLRKAIESSGYRVSFIRSFHLLVSDALQFDYEESLDQRKSHSA